MVCSPPESNRKSFEIIVYTGGLSIGSQRCQTNIFSLRISFTYVFVFKLKRASLERLPFVTIIVVLYIMGLKAS